MNKGQKKCIFIIDLLNKKGPMSRGQINEEIKKAFLLEPDLPRSTWNRYVDSIAKNTPYQVIFDERGRVYKLTKNTTFKKMNDSLLNCLMSSYNITECAPLLMKHNDAVYNADIVVGTEAISIILQAIDEQRGLTFTYTSFVNNTKKTRNFIPYFLSTWEGRWYLVAESETHPGDLYTYALDRMSDIKLSFDKVKHNVKISAEEYFKYSYGIQHSKEEDAKDIVIRAYGYQAQYVRSKKIHPTQEEINTCEEYADFRIHVAPCYNFYQNLLFMREGIEIISPTEVREEMKSIINKTLNLYK